VRLRLLTASSLFAGAIAAACQLLLPTIANDGALGAPDASLDPDGCVRAVVPSAPDAGEPGTISFFVAIQTIGVNDGGAALGYDLDGVCTSETASESCVPRGERAHPDQAGGRDIAGNEFLGEALQGALNATNAGDINARIGDGRLSYLIEVKRYNGTPNGQPLSVSFLGSNGLYAIEDGGIVNIRPSWDGGDTWTVDCRVNGARCSGKSTEVTWLADASISSGAFDPRAYVTGSVLVAQFPSIELNVGLTSLAISNVLLTATISADVGGGGYRLEGQIAGRIAVRDAFSALARLRTEDGGHLCGSDERFQKYVRPMVCSAADISDNPSKDGKGDPCEALSVALNFTALPARIGYRFDSTALAQGCDGIIADCKNE
jgi:hypothetical protein